MYPSSAADVCISHPHFVAGLNLDQLAMDQFGTVGDRPINSNMSNLDHKAAYLDIQYDVSLFISLFNVL